MNSKIDGTEQHIKFINDIYQEEYNKRMEKRQADLVKADDEITAICDEKSNLEKDLANKRSEIVNDNQKMKTLKYEAQIEEQKKNEANRYVLSNNINTNDYFRLLSQLNERQAECENKLTNQEQIISSTKADLDSLLKERAQNREKIFLTKEDLLDKDEEMRRQQRKINRIQATISDVSYF